MTLASASVDMVAPAIAAAVCRGQGRGCQAAIARLSLPPRRNVHKSAIRVPERELDRAGTQPKQASAHYVGGHTTKTFAEGIFSCFGHSIIALDHFAAV